MDGKLVTDVPSLFLFIDASQLRQNKKFSLTRLQVKYFHGLSELANRISYLVLPGVSHFIYVLLTFLSCNGAGSAVGGVTGPGCKPGAFLTSQDKVFIL